MKFIVTFLIVCFATELSLLAQAKIVFGNLSTPDQINAPVFEVDGLTRLSGSTYFAQLWAAPPDSQLAPIGEPVPFRADRAGYWSAVTRTIDSVVPGSLAQVQVRAWRAADGATFEDAKRMPDGRFGSSKSLFLTVDVPPGTCWGSVPCFPTPMNGLQSFSLIPEPSPWLLVVLGGGCIAFVLQVRRRDWLDAAFELEGVQGLQTEGKIMKRILILLLAGFSTQLSTFAQGTFAFGNRSAPNNIDAPVFDCTGAKLSGTTWLAQLWIGPAADSITASSEPVPFRTGAAAGYINTITVTPNNVSPGALAVVEMRVWRVAAGATFEAAFASIDPSPLGNYAKSNQLKLNAGGAVAPGTSIPGFPARLIGLEPFGPPVKIPEPATLVLGLVGAGLLLLKWRRKK